MESACVYGQKTLINELSQGIQMAKQLKVNLNSPEAREILIQKILASYDNALFVLKSGESAGQCGPNGFPASSPTESAITIASPQSVRSECNQPFSNEQGPNAVSKKRYFSHFHYSDYVFYILFFPNEFTYLNLFFIGAAERVRQYVKIKLKCALMMG